jgi:hypothetical protein
MQIKATMRYKGISKQYRSSYPLGQLKHVSMNVEQVEKERKGARERGRVA